MKSKVGYEEWRKLGYLEIKPLEVEQRTNKFCFATVLIAIWLALFSLVLFTGSICGCDLV